MKCPACGEENVAGMSFCTSCGEKLPSAEEETAEGSEPEAVRPTPSQVEAPAEQSPGEVPVPPEGEQPAKPIATFEITTENISRCITALTVVIILCICMLAVVMVTLRFAMTGPLPVEIATGPESETAQPTPPPTDTPTPSPTSTPTLTSTSTPTSTLTPTPTDTPTPMPSETPTPQPREEPGPEAGEESSSEGAGEEATAEPSGPPTSTPTVTPVPEVEGKFTYAILNTGGQKTLYEVYVSNADGTDRRSIALGFRQPSFQPGGHQIAMNGEGLPNHETIFVVDLSEGRPREVSANVEDSRPRWSPDGKQLIFFTSNVRNVVHKLGIDRDDVRHELYYAGTPLYGRDPSWLPDGRFVYNGCDDWAGSTNCGLYITDISGSTDPIRITDWAEDMAPAGYGEHIAFSSNRDGNWEIYVIKVDGSGLKRLTNNPANDGMPVWAPDGSLIAFLSDRDQIWAVWAIWPDGGQPFKLFELGGRLGSDWLAEQISWVE